MFHIIAVLALLLSSTARAEEPAEPKLGQSAIAEACASEFPGDPEAAKACEVTVRINLRQDLRRSIDHNDDEIQYLFSELKERDRQLALQEKRLDVLEAQVARLEATKKDKKRR